MGQVSVTINGNNYQVACDDGQESHLISLANYVNTKVEELAGSVGQIGDNRLLLMVSIVIADELFELRKKKNAYSSGNKNATNGEQDVSTVKALQNLSKRLSSLAEKISNT